MMTEINILIDIHSSVLFKCGKQKKTAISCSAHCINYSNLSDRSFSTTYSLWNRHTNKVKKNRNVAIYVSV
jgi:hypothetical protein